MLKKKQNCEENMFHMFRYIPNCSEVKRVSKTTNSCKSEVCSCDSEVRKKNYNINNFVVFELWFSVEITYSATEYAKTVLKLTLQEETLQIGSVAKKLFIKLSRWLESTESTKTNNVIIELQIEDWEKLIKRKKSHNFDKKVSKRWYFQYRAII